MAETTLKTDYKDDVLDTSVNERRKYQMIQNDDGTVSFIDATEYTQVGDSFGGADINATNGRLSGHIQDFSNPHRVTKSQVGLGNVPNVATNDQTPTFTEAGTRANITSGEKLSVILGKIKKFFADLKAVAFSGSYTDLINTPPLASTSQDGLMSWGDKNFITAMADWRYRKDILPPTTSGNLTTYNFIMIDFTGWHSRRFLIASRESLFVATVWSGSVSVYYLAGSGADVEFSNLNGLQLQITNKLNATNYITLH